MSQLLEHAGLMLKFHEQALEKLAGQLNGDQWLARLNDSSHGHWLLGHLAVCRRSLARQLGADIPAGEWEKLFGKGSSPGQAVTEAPDALVADVKKSGELLRARLAALTEEKLQAPGPRSWPTGSATVGGQVSFMVFFHEAYHLGQISLLCKSLGGTGLA